jgi:hypothetical protein
VSRARLLTLADALRDGVDAPTALLQDQAMIVLSRPVHGRGDATQRAQPHPYQRFRGADRGFGDDAIDIRFERREVGGQSLRLLQCPQRFQPA